MYFSVSLEAALLVSAETIARRNDWPLLDGGDPPWHNLIGVLTNLFWARF